MQSFILCAGHGTRMAPLSYILPKPLTPIFQKPLVQHILDRHYAAGVRSFSINISQHNFLWEKTFPEGVYRGCPLQLSYEESPLDSGGGLKKVFPQLQPDSPIIVQNGDILTDIPVDELLRAHINGGHKLTFALRSVDGHKNVGFDPATGLITDIRHALGVDAGSYQFAGIYVIDPSIAEIFPEQESFSIVPLWLELIKRGEAGGVVFDWCNWYEIGTPRQYHSALMELPNSQRIHSQAKISALAEICEDCVIGADAHIPASCSLTNCIVWPRTQVEAGEYRDCIITPRITLDLKTL